VLAVGLALAAALLYAVASVLQHRAALTAPPEHSMRLGLLVRLATSPMWVFGIAADVGGYVCQFEALDHGSLVLVQPLLVSGMLFALPLGAHFAGARLSLTDWLGAAGVCGGLSLFLSVSNPTNGRSDAGASTWAGLIIGSAVVVAVLVVVAGRGRGTRRAAALAGGAGVTYGLTAALTKTSSALLGHGLSHLLGHWQPYVLVVAGLIGMLLAQSAFQAGPLDASLPTLTLVDPAVSILIGVFGFGEAIAGGGTRRSLEIAGVLAAVAGVYVLGRSTARLESTPAGGRPGRPGSSP
jgi:drug/metabolite transporter (DMT)-like permease